MGTRRLYSQASVDLWVDCSHSGSSPQLGNPLPSLTLSLSLPFHSPPCPPLPVYLPSCLPSFLMEGNIDYQFHEKELRLVEEETQRRIKTLLEGGWVNVCVCACVCVCEVCLWCVHVAEEETEVVPV